MNFFIGIDNLVEVTLILSLSNHRISTTSFRFQGVIFLLMGEKKTFLHNNMEWRASSRCLNWQKKVKFPLQQQRWRRGGGERNRCVCKTLKLLKKANRNVLAAYARTVEEFIEFFFFFLVITKPTTTWSSSVEDDFCTYYYLLLLAVFLITSYRVELIDQFGCVKRKLQGKRVMCHKTI